MERQFSAASARREKQHTLARRRFITSVLQWLAALWSHPLASLLQQSPSTSTVSSGRRLRQDFTVLVTEAIWWRDFKVS